MTEAELAAARRHLQEMRELSESPRVIAMAEERVRRAEGGDAGESQVTTSEDSDVTPDVDPLLAIGLPNRVVEILHENAELLEDERLKTPEGIREWVEEGNDLDNDIDGFGPKYSSMVAKAVGIA